MNAQLPLTLRWPTQQRFATFERGANVATVALLETVARAAEAACVFVAGAGGSGKTHLLIAACAEATAHERSAQYLALAKLAGDRAAALRAFGGSDLLALDDLDAIVGDRAAEHALFDLYNRCKVENSTLLFTASTPPTQCRFVLPDLVSRLSACTQAVLKPLDEATRRDVVRTRAAQRGLVLDESVLDWLFARAQRDLGSLMALIERIDRESLAAQRRITVPFLRGIVKE